MATELDFLKTITENPDDLPTRQVFADWLEDQGDLERARLFRDGVVKRFGDDFVSSGGALTLDASDVCVLGDVTGYHTRTHDDGWTISGTIREDWYYWVNAFVATHSTLGRVEGDFEGFVFASSEEAFQDFYAKHKPSAWDYQDI